MFKKAGAAGAGGGGQYTLAYLWRCTDIGAYPLLSLNMRKLFDPQTSFCPWQPL